MGFKKLHSIWNLMIWLFWNKKVLVIAICFETSWSDKIVFIVFEFFWLASWDKWVLVICLSFESLCSGFHRVLGFRLSSLIWDSLDLSFMCQWVLVKLWISIFHSIYILIFPDILGTILITPDNLCFPYYNGNYDL